MQLSKAAGRLSAFNPIVSVASLRRIGGFPINAMGRTAALGRTSVGYGRLCAARAREQLLEGA